MIEIDCRGLEFTEFKADVSNSCLPYFPHLLSDASGCSWLDYAEFIVANCLYQGEWEAKGAESSTPFTGIDLSEEEWYDYDEKAGDEVSIKEINFQVGRA